MLVLGCEMDGVYEWTKKKIELRRHIVMEMWMSI